MLKTEFIISYFEVLYSFPSPYKAPKIKKQLQLQGDIYNICCIYFVLYFINIIRIC